MEKNKPAEEHIGTVVGYGRGTLLVRLIKRDGDCDCCALAAACGKADVVEVPFDGSPREQMRRKAKVRVISKSVLEPAWGSLVWLIVVAALFKVFNASDIWAVCGGISAMLAWNVGWWVYKRRSKPKFELVALM